MAKPGRNSPKPVKGKPPVHVDTKRTRLAAKQAQAQATKARTTAFPQSKVRGNPNIPIRTYVAVEVGNLSSADVQHIIGQLNERSLGNEHPHYFIPVRDGKMTSDIFFEKEFINIVNRTCEIQDGEIRLKGGAKDVKIIRKSL